MDDNNFPLQPKTYKQLVSDLLKQLHQRQVECIAASGQERETARHRFMETLHSFDGIVLYGDVRGDQ